MHRLCSAGRCAFRFLGCIGLNHFFTGWWAFRFFSAAQNVIGFYLASPHTPHPNASSEGKPCIFLCFVDDLLAGNTVFAENLIGLSFL